MSGTPSIVRVILFEAADHIGGLLRYGIPDFKMEKWVIDRRLDLLQSEGGERKFAVMTKAFLGKNGKLTGLRVVHIEVKTKQIKNDK